MFRIITVFILLFSFAISSTPQIKEISKKIESLKSAFYAEYSNLEKLKKEVEEIKKSYSITVKIDDKNEIAKVLNVKQNEMFESFNKCKELKEKHNILTYELAKEKHKTLSNILSQPEMAIGYYAQSCKDLELAECQKKAYNGAKKEAEKESFKTMIKKAKDSNLGLDDKDIKIGVQTNILSYSNNNSGFFYEIKTDVNAELLMDEQELFRVTRIAWNEKFDEPEEVPQLLVDNLESPTPNLIDQKEQIADSVYHSGTFVSLGLSTQIHKLSSDEDKKASAFVMQFGYKSKTKNRAYYEYERAVDSDDAVVSLHGLHMDWSINLQRALYPYVGLGYSIARLDANGYNYDGSAYHARVGVGYEISDNAEIDFSYRKSMIYWTIANESVSIVDLGMSRESSSYIISVSYLF